MEGLKIEKGVPVPISALGRERIYPFNELEVGDSFAVLFSEFPDVEPARIASRLRGSAAQHRRSEPHKRFAVRQLEDCVRCWRTQ